MFPTYYWYQIFKTYLILTVTFRKGSIRMLKIPFLAQCSPSKSKIYPLSSNGWNIGSPLNGYLDTIANPLHPEINATKVFWNILSIIEINIYSMKKDSKYVQLIVTYIPKGESLPSQYHIFLNCVIWYWTGIIVFIFS